MKSKKSYKFISFILPIFFCCAVIFCAYEFYHMEQEICELRKDVKIVNLHSDSTTQTEYAQTIDFMENEFAKYRGFIEKQQDFLIWLVGIIGAALTGLFTFFQIKGRKDIEHIIREQYTSQVQEEMGRFIGGQDQIIYLKNCIEKEERAKNKEILFVFQNTESESLMRVYELLEEQRYQVKKKKLRKPIIEREINRWTDENDIIVYQVDKSEFKSDDVKIDESVAYARLSKECDNKNVYSILYCENNTALERSLYKSSFYTSNANYGLTVIEQIFYLLYFV